MRKIFCVLIILCVLLPFTGCKKKQPSVKIPMAEKVQATEAKKETTVPEETQKIVQEIYTYDVGDRRDPFLSLVTLTKEKSEKKKGVTPFESYDIDQITLLAIAWDDQRYYGLITLPDKKSYTIVEGTKLGLYGGKVEKITKDMVFIREYIKDYRGNLKPKDSILKLRKEEAE